MNGAEVGITAARRAAEQATLVRALGGIPRHGPSVAVDLPAPGQAVIAALRRLIDAPPDTVVFMTGIGARHILGAATGAGMGDAALAVLRATRIVVRGTKPRRVMRELGIPVALTASPAEGHVVRDALLAGGVAGRRILVQCAGPAPDPMTTALRAAGAEVHEIHPYTIDLPADAHPAVGLARDAVGGRIAALTFTSAQAVDGFVAIAERAGVDLGPLGESGTLVAAVGPVTRRAIVARGLPVHVEPAIPRMGAMFQQLAGALREGVM